jgi:hypothetical protein
MISTTIVLEASAFQFIGVNTGKSRQTKSSTSIKYDLHQKTASILKGTQNE